MNTTRYLVASVVAAVWLFLYGFVANAVILMDYWTSHASPGLMRPEGEEILWAIALSCLLQGLALGYLFVKGHEGKGIGEGFRFGFLIAWFVAGLYVLFYAIQPWGIEPTLVSIVTDGLMYIGAGLVLAALYKA